MVTTAGTLTTDGKMPADEGPRYSAEATTDLNAAAIHAIDLRVNERITALDRVILEKLDAITQMGTQRAESSERAIAKVEAATEKRFESVNEFRSQLKDQAGTFMARVEIEARFTANSDRISRLELRENFNAGRAAAFALIGGTLVALIGAAIKVVFVK